MNDPNLYLQVVVVECFKCGRKLKPQHYYTHVYPEWSDGGRMVTTYQCIPCYHSDE